MGMFDVFKNKSGKSRKTTYSSGNKYITEYKKNSVGHVTSKTKAVKNTNKRKKS